MSNIRSISSKAAILDEASLWIYRLDRNLSLEEEKELRAWLAQSEQHRLALIKVGQVWDKAEALRKLADLFPPRAEDQPNNGWKSAAIAASVAALALSAWLLGSVVLDAQMSEMPAESELAVSNLESLYKTAVGEHTRLNLPDGTELVLNTNTTVRVNYSDMQRLLILEQGELHVQVAHDQDRPLSVIAGGKIVQAVGTAFNVELNPDKSVNLVVTEGKVLVGINERIPLTTSTATPIVLPVSSLAVAQGERVLLGQVDEYVEPIDFEEIEIQLSWREGNLIFRGEPLEDAVREIGRYTPEEFIFLDESLKEIKVAGLFETGDVDGLLVALSDSFQVDSQRVGHRILLNRR